MSKSAGAPRIRTLIIAIGCAFALSLQSSAPAEPNLERFKRQGRVGAAQAVSGPAALGEWSEPFELGVTGIHSTLLPTGEVLLFAYSYSDKGSNAQLWDPVTGEITDVTVPRKRELFCSGHILLPDGRVFVVSGTKYGSSKEIGRLGTDFFDPATRTWSNGPKLRYKRWYPTLTELSGGEVLIFSGQAGPKKLIKQVEIYDPNANAISTLPGSANREMDLYPNMHLLTDGRVLHSGPENDSHFFDPSSSRWTRGPYQNVGYRYAGGSVLLPGLDKVFVAGGQDDHDARSSAEILDLAESEPEWRTTASMHTPRMHPNAVLLPDGNVLLVGGNRRHEYGQPSKTPELFNPIDETWTELAPQQAPRGYHSTAVLLPDGRVLSAGNDHGGRWETAEVFSPPYLFSGPRPVIQSAPAELAYGSSFEIDLDATDDLARVALMKPGSTTHSVDFNQRYVDLEFTTLDATSVEISGPATPEIAPPGHYMLFAVDSNGVPSVATWVHID
jgi:galactose oxidase